MPVIPSDIKKFLFTTSYPPDKIVGVHTGSFTANASSTAGVAERTHHTINHSYGQTIFLQMTYSRDGGTTWQDQHVGVPDLTVPSMPVFQTLDVGCYSSTTQIVIAASNFTTGSITVNFRAAAFWKD